MVSILMLGSIYFSHKEQTQFTNIKTDEIHFKTSSVAKMIHKLQPKISVKKRVDVASLINKTAKKYRINPKIFVAIIDTESDFKKEMISPTGDLSMAQINVEIWNKEFIRLKKPLINVTKLKEDENYSIELMGQILSTLKKRYAHKDKHWYARYHSGNLKYKQIYLEKIDIRLAQM
jgi:hypothetical protein